MAAPAEKSVLETIFEDGEALGDDGFLAEDVEMVDAETVEDGCDHSTQGSNSKARQPVAGGGVAGDGDVSSRRGSQWGRGDGGKKRRKNKKTQRAPSDSRITDINRFVINTCRHLKEKKSYLVWSAVGCLGVSAVHDLVKESCGGQKTADGKRFRSGGGILWNILKTREPKSYKEIMTKGREFERQFRPQRTVDKRKGNGAAVFPTSSGHTERETEGSGEQQLDIAQLPQELPPLPEQSDSKGGRKSVLNRIRAPVPYDDLFEEGEII